MPPGQYRTVRLDIGAGVEQGIDGIDVVRTGRPVQRCFPMRTGEASVDCGAGGCQQSNGSGDGRVVPRPVGGDVQRGARGRSVAETLKRKRRMRGQQLRQTGEVSTADQLGERNHHRVVR